MSSVTRLSAAVCLAVLVSTPPVAAQSPSRPGPWVLDVRGVTSPVPNDPPFYPTLDAQSALVPDRGFGLDLGAHVYLLNIGPARLGAGANVFFIRAATQPVVATTTPDGETTSTLGQSVQVDLRLITPQVSFNFGSRQGWSYLSAGMGPAYVTTKTAGVLAGRREAGRVRAINAGGGARWFLKSHLAFSFDLRLHRLPAGVAGTIEPSSPPVTPPTTPPTTPPVPPVSITPLETPAKLLFTVSAGVSFR